MVNYKIHLIRHGMTENNQRMEYLGKQDVPLCEEGRKQLHQLRQEYDYPHAEMVFSSPLQRCRQSADILYPNHQMIIVDELRELDLGKFEGKQLGQLENDPDFIHWMQHGLATDIPGGEKGEDFIKRCIVGFMSIFEYMVTNHIYSSAAFTHGGVIMSLLSSIGLPKRPYNEWIVQNGMGYTLLCTPQMWMRSQAVEIFSPVPLEKNEFSQNYFFEE